MKKLFIKAISVMLAVMVVMSCLTAVIIPASAATENGYDRGYDGGFAGDGKIYCKGLDLSSWQKDAVNFTAIAAMGYDYIILRLGTSKMTAVDPCFEEFYAGAKAAGLDVGAYFYSYATTETAVQEDIAKCKQWLGDKKFEYPFYFDYEDKSQADLPTDTALTIINTFIDAFVEEGYLMGLYSMKSWMTQSWITSSSLPTTYEGWVAHYAGDGTYDAGYDKYGDTYSTQYGMYQWTDKHYFTYNGVKYGPYDADLCYKDYPAIVKEYGFNNYEPSGTAAARVSLQTTITQAEGISHRDYTEATITKIRAAYKNAQMVLADTASTQEVLENAEATLTALLAATGSNTIANNNGGIEIKARNQKITAGDCILYSPTWNDGLISVSNANIAYTVNVVFKWDANQGFNVVKSVSKGIGVNTPSIQLGSDEFLIAAHDWESGVTSGAVEGSGENYRLLSNLQVGDRIRLSGATALNSGTDVEPAAFAKFLPKNSVALYGRNTMVTTGSAVLFTPDFNGGLLTSANSNTHLTLNLRSKWDNSQNSWVVTEKWSGAGIEGESANIELESDEILFAAHYDLESSASIYNWGMMYEAQVGDKISFSGISPQSYSQAVSVSANISFSDGAVAEVPVPEKVTDADVTVTTPGDTGFNASLTDGVADTDLEGEWFGFLSDTQDTNCNTVSGVGSVTIDLGKRYNVSTILAHFYVGNGTDTVNGQTVGAPESAKVYVSVDGSTYYELGDLPLGECSVGTCWATYSGVNAVARYIRVDVNCAYTWTLLNEVQVLGTVNTAEGENVALGKECVSPAYTGSPYKASLTDGKATSIFQAGVNNSSWFGFYNSGSESTGNINPNNNNRGIATVDLNGVAEITGINIHTYMGTNSVGATAFDYINVYYSVDGVAYDYLGTINPTAGNTSPYWASFDASTKPVYARYVKLAVSATAGELILINEIQVTGTMITGNSSAQEGSMSTVALVGTFNNWNATPNMQTVDEDTVSLTMKLAKGTYEFKILGGNSWYGHTGTINNTTVLTSEEGVLFVYDGANNCVLNASGGVYTFVYNKMTNYLQVYYTPDTCYLRGSFNEWGTDTVMTENEDGTFSATLVLPSGEYEYKAANEDFSMEWPQFNATLSLERKSEVTFTLDILSDTITTEIKGLEYTVTFTDKNGNVLSTQTVDTGTAAEAPTVAEYEGYRFIGWSESFDSVTADITVKALYEKTIGSLKINVTGGSGFTISIDGSTPRPQGTTYINSKAPIGANVTVTANVIEDRDFLGWLNPANGQILTTEYSYSFTATGNDFYKALYVTSIEGVNTVIFKNDKAGGGLGKILDMQYYAAGDEIAVPADPTQVGFDFTGWNMTAEEIKAEIAAGNDVTVLANWELRKVYIAIDVTGGTAEGPTNEAGDFLANNAVTFTASEAEEGKKFAYWTVDGVVKNYSEVFKFYPSKTCKVEAVFVDSDATIDYQILVSIDTIDTVSVEGKNVFYYSWYVPVEEMGITFVKAGVLGVNKDNYTGENLYVGTTDSNVYDRSPSGANLKPVNTYSWTKSSVAAGQTWVAKAYVQYRTADGVLHTIYSDLAEATK